MKLQIRMNIRSRCVEIKVLALACTVRLTQGQTCPATEEHGALQKAADFVKAFMLGFDVEVGATTSKLLRLTLSQDAIALLRLDDLYLDSFEVTDGILPSTPSTTTHFFFSNIHGTR